MSGDHAAELKRGQRFEFGSNWTRFLAVLNEDRIGEAVQSLQTMLGTSDLYGKTFLDIGSGSGLFSLAARRLGATVHSFDYDPQSAACTRELRQRYFPGDERWTVEEGSALIADYLARLGRFDFVYSWGVLHHTGSMWQALGLAETLLNDRGTLFIALYNDQGWISRYWLMVKKLYNKNTFLRYSMLCAHIPYLLVGRILFRLITGRLTLERGMSFWYDTLDWLGGYPFEVAKPEEIEAFYHKFGLKLVRGKYCGNRLGCNEFVFSREQSAP